jgi:hypothetical protein
VGSIPTPAKKARRQSMTLNFYITEIGETNESIGCQLDRIERMLETIIKLEKKELMELNELQEKVTAESTVVDGAVVLLDNIGAFLIAHANDPAAIRAMGEQIDQKKTELADAIVRNTPTPPP